MATENLIGQKFGRLTVVGLAGRDKHGNALWDCKCDCGNLKKNPTRGFDLKSGITSSCGCAFRESEYYKKTYHGHSKERIYKEYKSMRMRCFRSSWEGYQNYGGRGITVCEEWKNNFMAFYEWAMSNGYNDALSLDRIDVNGNYEPSNCRWVSIKAQMNNKRNSRRVDVRGETLTVIECAEKYNINEYTLRSRIRRGYTGEDLIRPIKVRRRHAAR